MFTHYMNYWPTNEYGILSWLKVLPPFFASAVPVMFYIDWCVLARFFISHRPVEISRGKRNNRPTVEDKLEKILRRIDLMDIRSYYARSPASGLWLLEFTNNIIGMIAVDASLDATNDEPVTETPEEQLKKALEQKGTSRIATIRHFFAEEAYRSAKIEDDLLNFAVGETFRANESVSAIRILASPLRPAILESLRRNGFAKGDRVESIGMLGWEVCWYSLERSRWEAVKRE
jgi:hypothetical protein